MTKLVTLTHQLTHGQPTVLNLVEIVDCWGNHWLVNADRLADPKRRAFKLYKMNGKEAPDMKLWSRKPGTGPCALCIIRENIVQVIP